MAWYIAAARGHRRHSFATAGEVQACERENFTGEGSRGIFGVHALLPLVLAVTSWELEGADCGRAN